MKVVTYKKIMKLDSCYNPQEIGMPVDYRDTVVNFLNEYKDKVKCSSDIFWIVKDYMQRGGVQEFALFCANQVRHLMKDKRSIDALDVARKYLDGKASIEELKKAKTAAWEAANTYAAINNIYDMNIAHVAIDAIETAYNANPYGAAFLIYDVIFVANEDFAAVYAAKVAAIPDTDDFAADIAAIEATTGASYNAFADAFATDTYYAAQINWLINYFERESFNGTN